MDINGTSSPTANVYLPQVSKDKSRIEFLMARIQDTADALDNRLSNIMRQDILVDSESNPPSSDSFLACQLNSIHVRLGSILSRLDI